MADDKLDTPNLILPWDEVVAGLHPYIVRLSTPSGWGTGYFLRHSNGGLVSGIATAAHVVEHAHLWEDPIRIHHPASGGSLVVRHNERALWINSQSDTAVLIVHRDAIKFPEDAIDLAPKGKHLTVGNEVGWLGFPAIPIADLCFFSGRISAWSERLDGYLVDGNAINGVSGGPVVTVIDDTVNLIGTVSAYAPNRATGETLPGLAIVRSVERFHDAVAALASLDEAKTEEKAPEPPPDLSPVEPGTVQTRDRS